MKTKSNEILFSTALSYAAFLLTWGIGQALDLWLGESGVFIQLTFFMVVYIALTGIAIPLVLARRFGFPIHAPTTKWNMLGGMGALLLVSILGIFFSDALPLLKASPPSLGGIIKYLLLFIPMSLGICLQCFFLIPRSLEAVFPKRRWTSIVVVLSSVIAIGAGFWVDQLFVSFELALIQMYLGIFFAVGALLTRSLPLTYAFYVVTMLFNTLSEGKYYAYPWSALVIGFFAASLAIVFRKNFDSILDSTAKTQ